MQYWYITILAGVLPPSSQRFHETISSQVVLWQLWREINATWCYLTARSFNESTYLFCSSV